MKIALIVQRYGIEVNGGAELLCRQIAELLSRYMEVEIITTCALDYMTWENHYPVGSCYVNGVKVHRFPVDSPRDVTKFNKFSEYIFSQKHTTEDEINWMRLQGPYSTPLLSYIHDYKDHFDHFVFFTYLYCTTYFGLPPVHDKAVLIPNAHDEPPIYLSIFKQLFSLPKFIAFNTEEEKKFIHSLFKNGSVPNMIVGMGVSEPGNVSAQRFRDRYHITGNYLIYVGRVDESKGCKELFTYFKRYKAETDSTLKLVLMGKAEMDIPYNDDLINLGFVSEEDKFDGMMGSLLLIMPSRYESLSIVLLESWLLKRATLVNGKCEVLKGQCLKSNGGLWYEDYDEFKECLNFLISNEKTRERLGENGYNYVINNYSWGDVKNKYFHIFGIQ